MQSKALFSLALLSLVSLNEAFRILVFFPMFSKSHSILGHGFVDNLLAAGHEVVHITSFPKEKPVANLTEISIRDIGERYKEENKESFDEFKLKNLVGKANFADSLLFLYFTYDIHSRVLSDESLMNFFSDPKQNFDAVILEWFFHDSTAGVAQIFQCPLIWLGSTEPHWQMTRLVDDIPNPSYNPDLFSTSTIPLTFSERVAELWVLAKKWVFINAVIVPFEKYLYNRVFPEIASKRGVTVSSYTEAVYNASLLFVNAHPSYGTPVTVPQNVKYIGGYHINTKSKPLPEDLQKLMDQSKHGVIYFSLGSNVKSADMSTEMQQSLLKLFEKLKQTVIWKFESDLNKVPSNVRLVKWAPQQSILAHPNLLTFITHGGQLSTTEAIYNAVPVIGIPVMGDQNVNMMSVERKGFGIKVELTEDLVEKLEAAIKEMLTNPSYKNKARELSMIYHDRTVPPTQELVHWVEHVVRTRGAAHLRSPALDVPCYQKMYLDLIAVIAAAIVSLVFIKRSICSKVKSTNKEKTS